MVRDTLLQVVTDTDRRGAQTFAADLGEALAVRGWQVRTVALAAGAGDGLVVPTLGRRRLGPGTLAALRGAMRQAAVTIAHGSTTLPACALASLSTGVPFVYRNIGDPLFWAGSRTRRWRVAAGLGRAAAVTALWEGSARVLAERFGVPAEKLTVIPNGVPAVRCPPVDRRDRPAARAALELAPGRSTLGYVGALSPEKGLDVGIEALARLADCQLVVAGGGPLEADLRALADRLAPGRVRFLGRTDSPREVFAASDLVVLPSHSEGMPGVLIEAGLSGLPAVATDVGGVADIVVAGETGELVAPGDAAALAAAIGRLLPSADERGDAARRHCLARFELGVVADAWDAVLRALVP